MGRWKRAPATAGASAKRGAQVGAKLRPHPIFAEHREEGAWLVGALRRRSCVARCVWEGRAPSRPARPRQSVALLGGRYREVVRRMAERAGLGWRVGKNGKGGGGLPARRVRNRSNLYVMRLSHNWTDLRVRPGTARRVGASPGSSVTQSQERSHRFVPLDWVRGCAIIPSSWLSGADPFWRVHQCKTRLLPESVW